MAVRIKLKGPVTTREMALFYNWLGIDCISPAAVESSLQEANGDDVELEIASNGGYVTSAIDIYQMIRDYKGKVTARINYACSAATIIACAADESTISEAGFFMIHNAQSYAEGDKHDMAKEGKVLNAIDQGIISAYERKTGMSREKIQSLMSKDTYMTATEAIEKGFVDGLTADTDGAEQMSTEDIVKSAAAGAGDMIPEDKAAELLKALKFMNALKNGTFAPAQSDITNSAADDTQISGDVAGSDKSISHEGGNTMNLNEILAEHPEISNEIDERIATARAEGITEGMAQERARMKSLDEISANVTPELLNEAKYGDEPMDGPALAFRAMKENKALAATYMKDALADADDSNASDIGVDPNAGEETSEEKAEKLADKLASQINEQKGGK